MTTDIQLSGLATIGHHRESLNLFIDRLRLNHVKVLVDVRSRPLSRFSPQYNASRLEHALHAADIAYLFEGKSLGGLTGMSVYDVDFVDAMERVCQISCSARVAMMCVEPMPINCHRAYKLSAWVLKSRPEIFIEHIQPSGEAINARAFQDMQDPSWGWHELFPKGLQR